jgi:hypothetical protein
MGEVVFFVVAIAVGVLTWWCALRLLRRLYRTFREEAKAQAADSSHSTKF